MHLTLMQLATFTAQWRSLGWTDDDLRSLESDLIANPTVGDVVAGTGGLRKMRFAPPSQHQGKRGAARVAYAYFVVGDVVYLLSVYSKNEKADLTPEEKRRFREVLGRLSEFHAKRNED